MINKAITQEIINNIMTERGKQNLKFGCQLHEPFKWLTILMEEVGELSKEALEHSFKHKEFNYQELKKSNYRTELIQVAAVALAMAESLDVQAYKESLNDKS